MKTAYMGKGDVIVSKLSHPKLKGMLLCFNKSKRPLELKELKTYKKEPIDMKDLGKGLFQVYFPDKESFGRFIEHLNCIYNDLKENEMIGKPKYRYEDTVGFWLRPYGENKEKYFVGKVYIVDAYGTFEQNEEPSYDIMVEDFNETGRPCLVKHIRESKCVKVK